MTQINSSNLESSRFIVGLDLGTTNCAVAFYDMHAAHPLFQMFRIPQRGKLGHEELLSLLPSCIYLNEPEGLLIGAGAKAEGAKVPTRLVQSAKSWLSNPAANRKEKILPFESIASERRISPVEASFHLLEYIKHAWNQHFARNNFQYSLEEQEIILTVPASFDEVARTLTVEAATKAGFKQLTLLEEPQAAFYSWLKENGTSRFSPGETILVCDVGGGTTDFTLIDVIAGESGVELQRMAVGKHLLLGGDNMDGALCHLLQSRLDKELTANQYLSLLQQVRKSKEDFLMDSLKDKETLFLAGMGSQMIGGSLTLELTKQETKELLLEGFFGLHPFETAVQLQKGSGIRQMGLNYETEPSITKQLASFLFKNGQQKKPDYLLFNGGALKPKIFQERLIASLDLWYKEAKQLHLLTSESLDLAVARGAAYYGKLRHCKEHYITGGTPRSYYLDVSTKGVKQALTLIPRGVREGTRWISSHLFSLVPNQPVSFQLYHSNTRLQDKEGQLISIEEEEFAPLPPIYTLFKYGKKEQKELIPVQLEIYLSPVGTLELWCFSKATEHKWKLEFQLRQTLVSNKIMEQTFEVKQLELAQKEIQEAFAVGVSEKLNTLMSALEKILDTERRNWPSSVLRSLYDTLIMQSEKRLLSHFYESRFWNLAGFFLRPGVGYPLDDFRMKNVWKLLLGDFKKAKSEETELQQWICFRRIAAGLNKGQQIQLFNELLNHNKKKTGYAYAEHLRALASLELVEIPIKVKLATILLKKICIGKGEPCDYWALGRLGARQLFYGTVANVVPRSICENWVQELIETPAAQNDPLAFTLAMLARKTEVREIDLSQGVLEKVAPLLINFQDLIFHERELNHKEQERFFGDSLPAGLQITFPS